MVRRTKRAAEQTRERLLSTAAEIFESHGVGPTRLEDIAAAAGTTRGAIAWHFMDKEGLVTALLDQIVEPLDERLRRQSESSPDPLTRLILHWLGPLHAAAMDEQSRRAIHIVAHMSGLPAEFEHARSQVDRLMKRVLDQQVRLIRDAAKIHGIELKSSAKVAARCMQFVGHGLLADWTRGRNFDLLSVAKIALHLQLTGLGFSQDATRKASRLAALHFARSSPPLSNGPRGAAA